MPVNVSAGSALLLPASSPNAAGRVRAPKAAARVPLPLGLLLHFFSPLQCQRESADADLQPPSRAHPANPLGNVHSAGKLLPKRTQKNSVVQKWRVSVAVHGLARCQGREGGSRGGQRGWPQPGQQTCPVGAGASRPWLGRLCRSCRCAPAEPCVQGRCLGPFAWVEKGVSFTAWVGSGSG